MKNRKWVTVLSAAVLFGAGLLIQAGCGNADPAKTPQTDTAAPSVQESVTDAGNSDAETEAKLHTVTFYDSDGTTVLTASDVKDGESVQSYTPEKEGYLFAGWYGTPKLTHAFDFETAITADTSVFAGFVTYEEDTREFAVVGSGASPVLMESNWGKVIGDAQKMKKEESGTENKYTITLDLNEGDEFQFAVNTEWHDQRGYGYLDTIAADGTDYFQNSGSLGEASTKRSNIKCSVSGNYTFTLTTYPGEDQYETENENYSEENKEAFNVNSYDKITWTYNGAGNVDSADMRTDYYIKGAVITDWEDVYSDETRFVEADGIYTLNVALTKGDEFMFTSMVTTGESSGTGTEYIRFTNIAADDKESLSHVTEGGGANLVAAEDGVYTFTYDPSAKKLKVICEPK